MSPVVEQKLEESSQRCPATEGVDQAADQQKQREFAQHRANAGEDDSASVSLCLFLQHGECRTPKQLSAFLREETLRPVIQRMIELISHAFAEFMFRVVLIVVVRVLMHDAQ